MATQKDFTPEEWSKIAASPMAAGMAVTAADPGGLWSAVTESFASARALFSAKSDVQSGDLIKSVVAFFETSEGRGAVQSSMKALLKDAKAPEVATRCVEALKEVARVLDAKAPQESAGFKQWLTAVSQKVAEAGKEGGFLGFGGVRVSDAEKATLDQIKSALTVA